MDITTPWPLVRHDTTESSALTKSILKLVVTILCRLSSI